MTVVGVLVVIVLLGGVVWLVGGPLRAPRDEVDPDGAERGRLEAEKDAKYREIRDTEMDFRTGKLSDADFRAQDRQLRGEAVEILRELDKLR